MQTMIKYEDVTENWRRTATPSSHSVLDAGYVLKNGTKYYVDGKNVVLDYSAYEKEVALWLEDTLGGEFYMLPRVNSPEGIRTSDYLFRGEYWDLKEIKGNGKHTLDSSLKKNKNQAIHFIFDITKSSMTEEDAITQILKIYSSKDRRWVGKIILKNKNSFKIYKKRD